VAVEVNVLRGSERVGHAVVLGTKDQPDELAQSMVAEISKVLKP
jgi:hypothetical protein